MSGLEQPGGGKTPAPEKEPISGIREYLEKIADSEDEAASLLEEVEKHADKGAVWKNDEKLADRIGDFLNEHFGHLVRDKQAQGDYQTAQYYRDKLKKLLEELRGKE